MALAVTRVILRCEEAQETQVLGADLKFSSQWLRATLPSDVTVSSTSDVSALITNILAQESSYLILN